MLKDQWDEIMQAAVAGCLENMAFMEVFPAEPDAAEPADPVWDSLLVLEPTQGEFRLAMSRPLLDAIAANVYGFDTEITERQTADLLAELLNTIVGRFMAGILPMEPFKLGIPERGTSGWPPVEAGAIHWHFTVEEHTLSIFASGAPMLKLCQS